jgi:hypothetical protein
MEESGGDGEADEGVVAVLVAGEGEEEVDARGQPVFPGARKRFGRNCSGLTKFAGSWQPPLMPYAQV